MPFRKKRFRADRRPEESVPSPEELAWLARDIEGRGLTLRPISATWWTARRRNSDGPVVYADRPRVLAARLAERFPLPGEGEDGRSEAL
jgi:hypothetical protein